MRTFPYYLSPSIRSNFLSFSLLFSTVSPTIPYYFPLFACRRAHISTAAPSFCVSISFNICKEVVHFSVTVWNMRTAAKDANVKHSTWGFSFPISFSTRIYWDLLPHRLLACFCAHLESSDMQESKKIFSNYEHINDATQHQQWIFLVISKCMELRSVRYVLE